MKSRIGEKRKILKNGEELINLIQMDEYSVEDGVIEVAGYDRTVPVKDGVKNIPQIGAQFRVDRDSQTYQDFEDWYYKNETHDLTVIKTDGAGNEIKRELWPNTEVSKFQTPAYDAKTPIEAKIMVTFLPEDIIPIGAE